MTVTDSDQDRLTSETHLAHLRSYKTVRVQLVSHHSLVMLCGNVSPLPGKAERQQPHTVYSSCLAAGLHLITVKYGKLGNAHTEIEKIYIDDLLNSFFFSFFKVCSL